MAQVNIKDTTFEGNAKAIRVALGAVLAAALVALYLLRGRLPIAEWYGLLSLPTSALSGPVGDLADTVNIPLLSALLFGLIGALSPCQLSTNLAALAFTTRRADQPLVVALSTTAYLLGKVAVYTVLGLAAVLLGQQLQQASIPVIVLARKALGPALLLMGLAMLGMIRLRGSMGGQASHWLEQQAEGRGILGAFVLGLAFAFAFCPTLFWLFFGLTLPLAVTSVVGFVYPAVFALGASLPLLVFVAVVMVGGVSRRHFVRQVGAVRSSVNWVAGVLFLLVGLNEIVLYWLI
ncbi:MAG: sulfite exporter TauE/SafE family protein [Anaerolineae bacterium]|nr:sulfite exporter TauE/SafE family protein [Anaerolineae bacterium]